MRTDWKNKLCKVELSHLKYSAVITRSSRNNTTNGKYFMFPTDFTVFQGVIHGFDHREAAAT